MKDDKGNVGNLMPPEKSNTSWPATLSIGHAGAKWYLLVMALARGPVNGDTDGCLSVRTIREPGAELCPSRLLPLCM